MEPSKQELDLSFFPSSHMVENLIDSRLYSFGCVMALGSLLVTTALSECLIFIVLEEILGNIQLYRKTKRAKQVFFFVYHSDAA